MTREELKVHCLKQVEHCEMWAKHNGEEPSGKVYEEHKLILELLEQEPFINKSCVSSGVCEYDKLKALNEIRTEIEEYRDSMPWKSETLTKWEAINYILENIIDKHKESEVER